VRNHTTLRELKHPDQKKPELGLEFGGRSRNQESESGIA